MGRRGPKPQPTALRLLKGNPGKRAINHNEPVLPPGGDDDWACPSHLKGLAKKEWERQVPDLRAAGVLKLAHRTQFASYCEAYAERRRYQAMATKVGPENAIRLGYQGMVLKLRQQERQLAADFGLNAASQSQIKATRPEMPGSKLSRFTGGS